MQIAIISDIHSNLAALEAVLAEIDRCGVEKVYCLGDVVGYGADPAICIDLVRERCERTVLGNHDLAVATGEGIEYLPDEGQIAAEHNSEQFGEDQRAWLKSLPYTETVGNYTFVHASPGSPERWLRVESFFLAQDQFNHFDNDLCFVGHTHLPGILCNQLGVLRVREGHRYMINVGSVGQPRDGDPRASFGLFDPSTFSYELKRIPYNVERSVKRIWDEGLPKRLGKRLQKGS